MSEIIKASEGYTTQSTAKGKITFYHKLFLLYILNICDWICTEALLKSGYFIEANPVMQPVVTDFWQTILIKGILPLVLILISCVIFKWADTGETKLIKIMLFVVYSFKLLYLIFNIINRRSVWQIAVSSFFK